MANRKDFYFPSSDRKTQIHACEWSEVSEPVGIVQIAHGVSEYAQRYEPFAEFLNAHGYIVAANDHIGHGLSVAEGAAPLYFGEKDGWSHVVEDVYTLRDLMGKRFPNLPCFLLGHSMGSFIARTYLIRYPATVDGAIIMGTGQQAPALIAGGRLFADIEGKKIGFDRFSPKIDKLAFGAYNKPFAPNRTAFDWLSVNPDNVDAYISDPLCGNGASIGLFRDMLGGIGYIGKQQNVSRMNPNTPILFVSGDQDPVGDMGRGVRKAYASFKKAGVKDLRLKLYEGLRHEILNEREYETVRSDILEWLNGHLQEMRGQ